MTQSKYSLNICSARAARVRVQESTGQGADTEDICVCARMLHVNDVCRMLICVHTCYMLMHVMHVVYVVLVVYEDVTGFRIRACPTGSEISAPRTCCVERDGVQNPGLSDGV